MENQARLDRLLEEARSATLEPGVYLMKSQEGEILYVGKAKSLKNRLSSYFQPRPHPIARTSLLVGLVDRFDVILTRSETEALILEATLIKRHKPKYNVRLKDDKAYPYIRIDGEAAFPRLEWTRRVRRDEARYFGPFPSALSARKVLELLTVEFKLRDCSDNSFRHRSRACILFQMGKCTAPCVGEVSAEDYREQIRGAVSVLEGKAPQFIESLELKMNEAAEAEEFETAADYRDDLRALSLVTQTQAADEAGNDRARDVVAIGSKDGMGHAVVLVVRGGRIISVKHFSVLNFESGEGADDESALTAQVLSQHYMDGLDRSENLAENLAENLTGALPPVRSGRTRAPEVDRPQDILVRVPPTDAIDLGRTLGIDIRVPEHEVEKRLLDVAQANLDYGLEQALKNEKGGGLAAVEDLMKVLKLDRPPKRLECFDISNFQGAQTVASRVVFIDGSPAKDHYRRYNLEDMKGQNDFLMMKRVLERRFLNPEDPLPDLLVVDGGKGQLSQAARVLEELGVQGVKAIGLAKARTESDFQAKDVKSSMERVFMVNRKNPVMLYPGRPSTQVLTHLRDEAHRFAIAYHRLRRKKAVLGET